MEILVALIPALLWGILPVIVNKLGGKPINQQLGTAFGCGILALGIFIFARPEITRAVFLGCMVSGLAWSVGQLMQYKSYVILGTSKAFALSISIEMVLNSLVGVLIFHEWKTSNQLILGFSAIALVILGGNLTAYTSHKGKSDLKKGLITLVIGACGFCLWNYAIRFVNADGLPAIFPQAVGMVIGSLILSLFEDKSIKKFSAVTFKQILPGFIYAGANIALIFANKLNGVAVGYTMAQLCLVIETVLGLLFLHEEKTPAELKCSIAGAVLITAGCIMVGMV